MSYIILILQAFSGAVSRFVFNVVSGVVYSLVSGTIASVFIRCALWLRSFVSEIFSIFAVFSVFAVSACAPYFPSRQGFDWNSVNYSALTCPFGTASAGCNKIDDDLADIGKRGKSR